MQLCNSQENIIVRWGSVANFTVSSDVSGTATFNVGKETEAPIITHPFTITNGVGYISLTEAETSKPLGDYKYTITIDGEELPHDKAELPTFTIAESIEHQETA